MTRTELQEALEAQGIPTHDMEAAVAIWNLAIDAAHDTAVEVSNGAEDEGRWVYSESVQYKIDDEQRIHD